MTTVSPTEPLTAGRFLFGAQDPVDSIAQALDQQHELGPVGTILQQVSQTGRDAAVREVATATKGLLDLDLASLVVAGWRKHAKLAAAAQRTLDSPGTAEVVELATHQITSDHRLAVDLLVNDLPVATIRFQLHVQFTIQALVASVRNGRVVGVHAGGCEITATLACEGVELASRREQVEPRLFVRLPVRVRQSQETPVDGGGRHLAASSSLWPRTLTGRRARRRRRLQQARHGPPAD